MERPKMSARSWRMNGLRAPPPVSSTPWGERPSSCRIDNESRSAKPTPSSTARVRCARVWARLRPTNAPRMAASRWGVRSPWSYGRKVTPAAPAGIPAASSVSRSSPSPRSASSRANRSRYQANAPPAESTTPITYQTEGATWQKVWARRAGSTRGSAVGASTVPDVPQLATASPGVIAPTPAAPQALSAPPPTTGVPGTSPVSAAAAGSWFLSHSTLGSVKPSSAGLHTHSRSRPSPPARSVISAHSAVVRPSHHSRAGRITSAARSRKTEECICPEMPTARTRRADWGGASSCRMDARDASHHVCGCCSAQPGRGVLRVSGVVAVASTSPASVTRSALTPLVPTSRPRKSASATLSHAQQQLHGELVKPLIGVSLPPDRREVERLGLERAGPLGTEDDAFPAPGPQLGQELLNLRIGVEALGPLLQDQVGAHAPGGEVPDAVLVLRAIGVAVEVPHPRPARVFEQLHEEESSLGVVAPEPQVLIEASLFLPVQVDVKQFARVQRLRHGMRAVEPGHLLVCHLGVEPDHFGVIERVDERQHVASRGEEDVAARLVGLRLQGESQVVALRADVIAQEVDGIAVPSQRATRVLGGIRLDPLAAAPEDVHGGAELDPQVDGRQGLLQGVRAHPRVVAGERTVSKGGVGEQVRRRHRNPEAGGLERRLELPHDPVALAGGGVHRHEVVVVQVHAVGTQLGELVNDSGGRDRRADRLAERIAARVPHRPETEREMMLRLRRVRVLHGSPVRDDGPAILRFHSYIVKPSNRPLPCWRPCIRC